ncbi:MAG: cupin domain-containing protein [Proteobacteria bacterium]|nr:cupin domain-containing protein [Pseudomonadota bacterium]
MKEQQKLTNLNTMKVISRSSIPVISSVMIDNVAHNLGQLLDFRKHSNLASFIPENARPSFAWTKLRPNEELAAHEHPTSSMIIICEGQGEVFGDCEQELIAGDIVIVPPHHKHGFWGRGENGFWALSIQFEGAGLYENVENARVHFIEEGKTPQNNNFSVLLDDQKYFMDSFKSHPLIQLVHSTSKEDTATHGRLLEALNIWGNWFQRIIYLRAAVGGSKTYQDLAEQHILEEVGHNTSLLKMRGNKAITLNDPILDATASWFFEKMLSSTIEEKTVLVHFVLEGAGEIFHTEALHLFGNSSHFKTHVEEDENHFEIGAHVLEASGDYDIERLRVVLSRGWEMFNLLLSRIAYFAEHGYVEQVTHPIYEKAS